MVTTVGHILQPQRIGAPAAGSAETTRMLLWLQKTWVPFGLSCLLLVNVARFRAEASGGLLLLPLPPYVQVDFLAVDPCASWVLRQKARMLALLLWM